MQPTLLSSQFPVAESLRPWSGMLAGRKFIWLLAPPWDGVWTRQNHFATRVARLGGEVLYVENPGSWTSLVRQGASSTAGLKPRVRTIEPRLHVMTPGVVLPGTMYSQRIAAMNGRRIRNDVDRWAEAHGWREFVAWCRVPHSLFALDRASRCSAQESRCSRRGPHCPAAPRGGPAPTTVVYDITDDYELYASSSRSRRLTTEREQKLIGRADLVLLTTKELRRKKTLEGIATHVVPNGVDYELFASAGEPGPIAAAIQAVRRPVIGYIGLTSHWMDFDLLAMLGRRWPNQVVMVGPIAPEVQRRARSIPGIVWTGFIPQRDLAPYLRGFSVCIMPHLVNELRQRSNPLKTWEYLASGKPFISVNLPAMDAAREYVDVATSRGHFVELVDGALIRAGSCCRASQHAARRYSWDTLFHSAMRCLQPKLSFA